MTALAIDLLAEVAAAGAFVQVPAQVGAPERAAVKIRELLANLRAVGLARSAAGHQRLAGLEHECLYLFLGDPEHISDLLVAERVHLRQDERRALLIRQAPQVGDEVTEILTALHLRSEPLGGRLVELAEWLLAPGAQHRVTPVARDREQPGAQMDRLVRGREVVVGRQERVLDGVLGFLEAPEHVAAERQDRAVVAVVGGLERRASPSRTSATRRASDATRRRRGDAIPETPAGAARGAVPLPWRDCALFQHEMQIIVPPYSCSTLYGRRMLAVWPVGYITYARMQSFAPPIVDLSCVFGRLDGVIFADVRWYLGRSLGAGCV